MTIGPSEHPSLREHPGDTERYLAAVADTLVACSIQARLSSDGCIPTLLATDSRSGRAGADVTMRSDIWIQAAWAPAPGTDPATTADTILAVLNAISPGMSNRNRAPRRSSRGCSRGVCWRSSRRATLPASCGSTGEPPSAAPHARTTPRPSPKWKRIPPTGRNLRSSPPFRHWEPHVPATGSDPPVTPLPVCEPSQHPLARPCPRT
jgi:hypothetical protein